MPRRDDRMPIHILVSKEDHQRLREELELMGVSMSDYIRTLVKRDMLSRGVVLDLELEHGGHLRRKDSGGHSA